jgi:hypothetical protein
MLANALLDTPLIVLPGMTDDEIDALWNATYRRSKMLQAFLDRQIDAETYLDFMAQEGYEPEDLISTAEQNLDFAIQQKIVIAR